MELRHLRYFCAVADTLNFSRAAERLHVAQSALSRQIRDLEEDLGFKLFVRTTSQVRLTDAGRHFHTSTEKLLGQLALAISAAQEVVRGKGGDLNIASDWRIPIDLVPETVRNFRQKNPNVTVNFFDMSMPEELEALRAGKVHLAFLPDIAMGAVEDLNLLQVYTSEIVAVLPSFHPLAHGSSVRLRDLRKEKWVVGQDKHGPSDFRSYVIQMCRPAGFTPIFGRTTDSASGMLTLVGAGEGVALIPEIVFPSHFGGVRALRTDCPPMKMYAVWLKSGMTPQIRLYLDILRKGIKSLGR